MCGIIRTTEIESIERVNYTEDTVPLIVWSGAELTVTMVCIGVAVLIPLYKYLFVSGRRRRNKQQQSRRPQWREPIDWWNRRFDPSPNELTRTQDEWEQRVGLSPYLPDRYARGSACEAGEAANNSRYNKNTDPERWQSRDTEHQHSVLKYESSQCTLVGLHLMSTCTFEKSTGVTHPATSAKHPLHQC